MSNFQQQLWNQLYQHQQPYFVQFVHGAINQAPFNPHAHGYQPPTLQHLPFQPAFANNGFHNGFQNSAIHPALLNNNFQAGTQNYVAPQAVMQHPVNQLPAPQHIPIIQNIPAINPVTRAKAPRRKRAPRKPKAKPAQPLKKGRFRFMELPLEIRLMIYKLLLMEDSTALILLTYSRAERELVRRGCLKKQQKTHVRQVHLKTIYKPDDETVTHLQPVILRVCKQVYDEAISILYRQTLEFEHPIALQKFLFTIGPANRLLLQHIVLRGWQDGEYPVWQQAFPSAFDRLLAASNLKSILMDRHVHSSSDLPREYGMPKYELRPVQYFNACVEYWVQCIDATRGKGTARSLLKFTDRNFGSEDEIAQDHQDFLRRKKLFMDNMKLG
ncbi:hypothetical protein QM012_005748 [Aureobasidium pullulans]|uniref:DUF7730 domain-containing protein n=1 Tax=Aureobasidium pullulans TaxID=5580 RepID=A0ABR0TS99_AURPU